MWDEGRVTRDEIGRDRSLCLSVMIILAAGIIAGWCSFAYCEGGKVILRSALVWRADGKGDYLLPQLPPGVSEVKETFVTDGQIKSIVVSWKSKGSVSLEGSIDGGSNYIPVINGVPVYFEGQGARGKGQGKHLKWKANIGVDSQLSEVSIVYSDTFGVAGSFGNPALSGFKYRKLIHLVPENISEAVFNQPVKLCVSANALSDNVDFSCDSSVTPDFRDIRFTAADGVTLLPYYIGKITEDESGQIAEIFVTALQIPVWGVDIYVYYGNKLAADFSSIIEDIAALPALKITVSQEEAVELNKFEQVTVKENGNLGLIAGAVTGSFTSAKISAAFAARIINAVYTVQYPSSGAVKLDISADGGSTYRANCVSSKYYYASMGDFSMGNELVYHIAFSAGSAEENQIEVSAVKLDYSSGEVALISPNGGEIFVAGEEAEILWSAPEYGVYNLKLEYSIDNAETFKLISASLANSGSFIWLAAEEFSDKVLVKISDPFAPGVFDVSDKPFSICSKEEALRRTEELKKVSAAEEEINLSGVVDDTVKRSDAEAYDILVKVRDNLDDPDASWKDAEVTYKKGEVIEIKPGGYEWGSSEKKKFLIIQVYLIEEELDDIKTKHINTGPNNDGAPLLKMQKSIINLEKLGFYGKKIGDVRKSLENNILRREIVEQVVE